MDRRHLSISGYSRPNGAFVASSRDIQKVSPVPSLQGIKDSPHPKDRPTSTKATAYEGSDDPDSLSFSLLA